MLSLLNIKIQTCGLIVLFLVTFFFARIPKINVRTIRMFRVMLVMAYLCTITDILSIAAVYYADSLSPELVNFSGKIYLFFLMSVLYCGLLYLFSDIYKDVTVFVKMTIAYSIIMAIASILMLTLPIYFVCEDEGRVTYSYGPSTTVVYITFAIFFVALIVHTLMNRATIQPRRRSAILLWLAIWALSALGQLLMSHLLIVSYAVCLGVLIIFSMIENPELNLNRESTFFNISAMVQYMTELYGKDVTFSLVTTNYRYEDVDFYASIKDAYAFAGIGEIYLVFTDRVAAQRVVEHFPTGINKRRIYIIWDSSIAHSANYLLTLLREARDLNKREKLGETLVIDNALKKKILDWDQTRVLIEESIRDDRIEVFYQPIYSVKEKMFRSAEALVRIRDRNGDLVPPGKFIPVAEENKTIITLGKIIFGKVCDFLNREDTDALGLRYVEVNLSVVQAEDEGLAADIIGTMEKYAIESSRINLEITETASITGRAQLLKTMETLQGRSIYFSLDDFGTGQSNLDYMASMPVQIVKFDRSMTQTYFISEKTRAIIDAAIEMIHGMGMKIVAEGIESEEQFRCMEEKGVDFIQGFYFSKPVPEAEFIAFIREHNLKGDKA